MRDINTLILPDGEELEMRKVFQAVLLLARANADFPIITEGQVQLALLQLIPVFLEYNEAEGVI